MNITARTRRRPDDIAGEGVSRAAAAAIPLYLRQVYWWAYIDPRGVRLFDRQWLTNLILWGNFARLRDAAIAALGPGIGGRTLQVACVYGDFSRRLLDAMAPDGRLDVIDIVPVQLSNLAAKLPDDAAASLQCDDAGALGFASGSFDQAVLFFLLHEQPADVRRRSVAEAWRVLRPGGRLVVMDYHRPRWWHPLRYLFPPVLRRLEPFALDLWSCELPAWLPPDADPATARTRCFFGGLYQLMIVRRIGDDRR
jgi:ubiquinone/menaquinone biosynthesis C-methylase UbiE